MEARARDDLSSASTTPVWSTIVDAAAKPVDSLQAECGNSKGREGGSINALTHTTSLKAPAIATSLSRVPKRSLQGKYELKLYDGGCRGVRAAPSSIMKILCWNCRGLGNPTTVQFLGNIIAQHDPDLVFLCETHLKQSSSSRIQFALNLDGCFVVDYGSGCTGLMLLWNRRITVNLLLYSSIHIDVSVVSASGSFHVSSLHGHCVEKHNHQTWSLIDRLCSLSTLPWLVGGDLNEILCNSEKEEVDVNLSAKDRGSSDYFRYDMCWSKEDACIERVRSTWLRSSGPTISKLQAIGDSLRSWQADWHDSITNVAKASFLDAKREHKSLLDKDEAYWAQRARVIWLTQSDHNTAYFHTRASGRRKKNYIRGLFNENDVWTDKQAEVAGVAMRYFTTLFASSQPKPNSSLLSNIDHCINSDMNISLLRPFTDAKIIAVFQDINPTKAPDIDGLPGSIFRQQ
ncbi:hypothetical protein GQ457_18G004510 [Hibiscus cannabinus]